jgi:hypothetical protein
MFSKKVMPHFSVKSHGRKATASAS